MYQLYLLSACVHVFEIGRVPSRNDMRRTNILIFSRFFFISDYAHNRRSSVMITFPTEIQLENIRRRHSSTFFQDMYYCTKKKSTLRDRSITHSLQR